MSIQQTLYLRKQRRYKNLITFLRIALFILFLGIWELAARLDLISAFVFSSPSRIAIAIYKMTIDGTIFKHSAITITETFISFALIVTLSITTALLLWLFKPVYHVTEPYLIVLNSLPKSALAPMIIVWLGNSPKAIIVTAISVALFGSILSIYTSFIQTDSDKIKLMQTFGANRFTILNKLILPASLTTIVSNMKVNIGLCLVGVIIGEFLAAKSGLGYLIIYSSQIFKMDHVAMAIVILCIVSIILFKLVDLAEKLIVKKF